MNSLNEFTQLGINHSHLLSYLDRLKNQAEELLRDVRGVYIKTNPTNANLKMKYEEEIGLKKEEYVKEMRLLDEVTVFILYSDQQYTVYNAVDRKQIGEGTLHNSNFSNLSAYNSNSIIYFDMTSKSIIIYDLVNCKQLLSFQIFDRLIEESLVFRLFKQEIVITYKKGDFLDEDEAALPIQHAYLVCQLEENLTTQKIDCIPKHSNTFSQGGLYCDTVHILKNKSLILYNSFTKTNDQFIYQEYRDDKIRSRQRQTPLQGQVIRFVEFPNSNRVGFIINLHSDSQFKFIAHDLDQMTEIAEQHINFLQITKHILITNVFCFLEDRYIGLQVHNLQFGCRNIIYDIENQSIISIIQGNSVADCHIKNNKMRLLLHNDDDGDIRNHSLKLIYFSQPKIVLMKYLIQSGILSVYGEQPCKEILEMIH